MRHQNADDSPRLCETRYCDSHSIRSWVAHVTPLRASPVSTGGQLVSETGTTGSDCDLLCPQHNRRYQTLRKLGLDKVLRAREPATTPRWVNRSARSEGSLEGTPPSSGHSQAFVGSGTR